MTITAPEKVLVILGPTGSGKSALAHEIARRRGGEILAVDSMTVYRGMDIGTAKPTVSERAEVVYHLIDVIDPSNAFTVAKFVEMANVVIKDARQRGVPLIATGGTPLYYKALFEGLFDGPTGDPQLRERLVALGNEAMHLRLKKVDPVAATRIHVNDTKRLVRALEVYELTGKSISSLQTEWSAGASRHPTYFVGLLWEKEVLNRRINARVKAMMECGWVEEVRRLLERYGQLSKTAADATGYADLIACVNGVMKLEEAFEQIKIAHRQLARKQMKWFRRFTNVKWLAGDRGTDELAGEIIQLW